MAHKASMQEIWSAAFLVSIQKPLTEGANDFLLQAFCKGLSASSLEQTFGKWRQLATSVAADDPDYLPSGSPILWAKSHRPACFLVMSQYLNQMLIRLIHLNM